jgi:hypothetical protein
MVRCGCSLLEPGLDSVSSSLACQDMSYRAASDLQPPGDHGFADTCTSKLPHLVGVKCGIYCRANNEDIKTSLPTKQARPYIFKP